jgi:hypothetical protein
VTHFIVLLSEEGTIYLDLEKKEAT